MNTVDETRHPCNPNGTFTNTHATGQTTGIEILNMPLPVDRARANAPDLLYGYVWKQRAEWRRIKEIIDNARIHLLPTADDIRDQNDKENR